MLSFDREYKMWFPTPGGVFSCVENMEGSRRKKSGSLIGVTSFSHTSDFVLMYKCFEFNCRILANRVP